MSKLFPIAAEYLPAGTVVEGQVYTKNKVPVLLIGEGTVLTDELMLRLRSHMSNSRNIYVEEKYYETLLSTGIPQTLKQEFLEKAIGYNQIKGNTNNLLENITETQEVSSEQADEITSDIYKKVETIDTSFLLQCVNGKNSIDEYLMRHCTNVAMLNGMFGRWLDFPAEELQLIIKSGLLHDVGKTKVPQDILYAPRALTPEEFDQIKMHSVHSYELIKKMDHVEDVVAQTARSHHEKLTGTGYPDGLKGDEIPLFARITAISDVYDAMVSSRCYKDAISPFFVLDQLAMGKFSDLDFQLIELFLEKMATELVGKSVLLSSGAVGKVQFINTRKWSYPIVQVDDEVVVTSSKVYCVAVIL